MSDFRYVGNGSFLAGVPARDLSAEEAEGFNVELLIASGLYERVESSARRRMRYEVFTNTQESNTDTETTEVT